MARTAGMTERPEALAERPAPSSIPGGRRVATASTARAATIADAVLGGLRVESAVLCRSVMTPPWGFAVESRPVGSFHVVVRGEGWLEVDGVLEQLPLAAGDVVVLAKGNAHRVTDEAGASAPALTTVLAQHEVVDGELRFGGRGTHTTEIVCGTFSAEGPWPPAWAGRLPTVVRSSATASNAEWRTATAAALQEGAAADGGSVVVNRLLESLLADALRDTYAGDTVLPDRRLAPAVRAIHDHPEAPWTTDRLAAAAAMSRTTFADAFRVAMGAGPITYVRDVRLELAARLLRTTDRTVGEIARRVGYAEAPSLSRAFKARFGTTPDTYRRRGGA